MGRGKRKGAIGSAVHTCSSLAAMMDQILLDRLLVWISCHICSGFYGMYHTIVGEEDGAWR